MKFMSLLSMILAAFSGQDIYTKVEKSKRPDLWPKTGHSRHGKRALSGIRRLHLAPASAWHVCNRMAPGSFKSA